MVHRKKTLEDEARERGHVLPLSSYEFELFGQLSSPSDRASNELVRVQDEIQNEMECEIQVCEDVIMNESEISIHNTPPENFLEIPCLEIAVTPEIRCSVLARIVYGQQCCILDVGKHLSTLSMGSNNIV